LQKVFPQNELTQFQRTHGDLEMKFLKVRFVECPVSTTLGVLGKKWALVILRDIGDYGVDRFNRLLESLPRISPRVLATRLKELESAGLIERVEKRKTPSLVRWALTEKGVNAIPIIIMIAAYGSKYNADVVFADKQPRKLPDILNDEGMELIQRYF
jgi:DNA-binding HxlR family transcriptional regulator